VKGKVQEGGMASVDVGFFIGGDVLFIGKRKRKNFKRSKKDEVGKGGKKNTRFGLRD